MGKMTQVVDIDSLHQARAHVLHELSVAAEEELLSVYEFLTPSSTDYIFSNEVCLKTTTVRCPTSEINLLVV